MSMEPVLKPTVVEQKGHRAGGHQKGDSVKFGCRDSACPDRQNPVTIKLSRAVE